jgi:hypothetical protein
MAYEQRIEIDEHGNEVVVLPVAQGEGEPDREVDWLTGLRAMVANGRSVYGEPDAPRAAAKLAEIDAKLELLQRQGRYEPPEPVSVESLARQELGAAPDISLSELLENEMDRRLNELDELPESELVARERGVAADLAASADAVTLQHSVYRRDLNRMPAGSEILEALAGEAKRAIAALVEPEQQLRAARLVKATVNGWSYLRAAAEYLPTTIAAANNLVFLHEQQASNPSPIRPRRGSA